MTQQTAFQCVLPDLQPSVEQDPICDRFCFECFRILSQNPVKVCSRCLFANYCGRECQRKHWWEMHKEICNVAKDVTPNTPIIRPLLRYHGMLGGLMALLWRAEKAAIKYRQLKMGPWKEDGKPLYGLAAFVGGVHVFGWSRVMIQREWINMVPRPKLNPLPPPNCIVVPVALMEMPTTSFFTTADDDPVLLPVLVALMDVYMDPSLWEIETSLSGSEELPPTVSCDLWRHYVHELSRLMRLKKCRNSS